MKIPCLISVAMFSANLISGAPSLIGTWKSSKELTLKATRLDSSVEEDLKERFENLFGRMTITYTKAQSIARMEADEGIEEWESITDYRIVAETKDKLSIKWIDENEEVMTATLHFVNQDQYWIELPKAEGKICGKEYFIRQPKAEPDGSGQ
ncbi:MULTISPECIES: hypothetical protein [unclassified Lentimonas]|uniref:hypothetical protein n=1 Tax=unclassified Lentimonas TaxID=2630993 RepID=UPI001322FFBB|nr:MULTISPECIES: hypothetical protein [unclassified Lentimonas]CAA6678053.1 Unannotated [Lentimonas sp. CC4]CAA6687027.1 Unannotated [Lentimonas sp. CC6]CAA7075870.1 Unannotated [Lentimonas sp. CC4]CAA7172004.1 Unannotated [Lentimonas sp. CC21]CAA7182933.1 Unannotated [Lentimonas sp. CC8]